jgi:dTDP-glucose 4,6-dehydratase
MTKRVLVTGISGMIGSAVADYILEKTDWHVVGIASWAHRGTPSKVLGMPHYNPSRVTIVSHDLSVPFHYDTVESLGQIDYILNVASESHVDRSIDDPVGFSRNNVNLALHMLELARAIKPQLFLQFSTDEVYGVARENERHAEWSPIVPSNPYAASKAAQEAFAVAYWRTYGVPVIITNTMNVFTETQDFEKFIPLVVRKVIDGERVDIHAYPGCEKAGSRYYIHARNVADAVLHILRNVPAASYGPGVDRPVRLNIVGEKEVDNLTLAQMVARFVGRALKYRLVDFHSSRPGHDQRYALDGDKMALYGWRPKSSFEQSLEDTALKLAARWKSMKG